MLFIERKQWDTHSLAFSPDGNFLATGTAGKMGGIWELMDTSSRLWGHTHKLGTLCTKLVFLPESQRLLIPNSYYFVLFDPVLGRHPRVIETNQYREIGGFDLTENDGLFLGSWFSRGEEAHAKVHDTGGRRFHYAWIGGGSSVVSHRCHDVVALPTRESVAFCEQAKKNNSSRFVLRSTLNGEVQRILECQVKVRLTQVAASPHGDTLVARGRFGTVHTFNLDSGDETQFQHPKAPKHLFTAIAFHPSGRYVGAASDDGIVRFYDPTNWQVAQQFNWNIGKAWSIAFSQDGALAAAGGDKKLVVVWDVDS